MAELSALEDWTAELLRKLQPSQQRRLLVEVARRLRTANAQRMRAQTDPEGQAWQPRKPPGSLRSQRERLRQQAKQRAPMFVKLRKQRHLKAKGQGNAAVVEFAGRAQRIAQVHHFGETDAVYRGGPRYDYPYRELLGITEYDIVEIRELLLQYLSARSG